jgi:hypothetical protein
MRRPLLEKEKSKKGCGWFIIILILLGIAISAYMYGKGWIDQIIHP